MTLLNESSTTEEKCGQINNSISLDALNNSTETLYDQIINEYGYGKEIWKIIISTVCLYIVNSYFTNYFPNMVIAYKKKYDLSEDQIAFTGLIFFIGKMSGSLSTGFVTNYISREKVIRSFLLILLILNFLKAFVPSLIFFYAFRIITGYLVGVLEVIINNLLCESLPSYYRSFTLNASYSGFSIAQIICNLIMLFTMPNMEVEGIATTHLIFTIFLFIVYILSYIILSDSPRNLLVNGRDTEAFEILYRIKDKRFFTVENKRRIISEIRGGVNVKADDDLFSIFTHKNFMWFTFCVAVCDFGYDVLNDGGRLLTNFVFKMINEENQEKAEKNILVNNIIINLVNPFSCFMFGYLSETNLLGRRTTISFGFVFISISLLLTIIFPSNVVFLFTVFTFFCNVGNSIFTYTSEVYPTKIRDTAMGWMNFISYVGSASSQYFLILPLKISWRAPIILMLVISTICAVVILFSPFETLGRALDFSTDDVTDTKNNKYTISGNESKDGRESKDEEKVNLISNFKIL